MKKISLFVFSFLPTLLFAQWTYSVPADPNNSAIYRVNGNVGIGTSSPAVWFGSKTFEFSDTRPVFKLASTSPTGISTMIFTNSNVNSSTHLGEFHTNYYFNQTDNTKSLLTFYSYPGDHILSLLSSGNVGIGTSAPGTKLTMRTSTASQGFVITNCDNVGAQSHFGFTTADQPRLGLATESYLNLYSNGKWNFNSGNSNSGITMPISFSTNDVSRLFIKANGFVGVATTNPQFQLEIPSNTQFSTGNTYIESPAEPDNNYVRSNFGSNVYWNSTTKLWTVGTIGANDFCAMLHTNGGSLAFYSGPSTGNVARTVTNGQFSAFERMRIDASGNVGIGTTAPDAKLAVKGIIHTQEVRVDMTGAMVPDYVFENDYNLPTLTDLEAYIKVNKHLPEVPSACVVEESGVNLGEMNMVLLKKVEELTLYLIEQNKIIQDQNSRLLKLEEEKKN